MPMRDKAMPTLRETQEKFAAAITGPETDDIAPLLRAGGVTAVDRMGVYRDNYRAGLTAALRDVFPVVAALVGGPFMNRMARDYIAVHPPPSADMNSYGAAFPAFIAAYTPARAVPYLADAAHWEWACHAAYHAPDDAPADMAALARRSENAQAATPLRLRAAVSLIRSRYPLPSLCAYARAPQDTAPDINAGGGAWLVARPAQDVLHESIPAAHHDFYAACAQGYALADAAAQAMARHPDFDLAAALQTGARLLIFRGRPEDR